MRPSVESGGIFTLAVYVLFIALAVTSITLSGLAYNGWKHLVLPVPTAGNQTTIVQNNNTVVQNTTYTIWVNNTAVLPTDPTITAGFYGDSTCYPRFYAYQNRTLSDLSCLPFPSDWPVGGGLTGSTLSAQLIPTGIPEGLQCPPNYTITNAGVHANGTVYSIECTPFASNGATNGSVVSGDLTGVYPVLYLADIGSGSGCINISDVQLCWNTKGQIVSITPIPAITATLLNSTSTFTSSTISGTLGAFDLNVVGPQVVAGTGDQLVVVGRDQYGRVTLLQNGSQALTVSSNFSSADITGTGTSLILADKGLAGVITCPAGSFVSGVDITGPGTWGPTKAICTAIVFNSTGSGIQALIATSLQTTVTPVGDGSIIQIGTVQNIDVTSSPRFTNLNLTGKITAGAQNTRSSLGSHTFSLPSSPLAYDGNFELFFDGYALPLLSIGRTSATGNVWTDSGIFWGLSRMVDGTIQLSEPTNGGFMITNALGAMDFWVVAPQLAGNPNATAETFAFSVAYDAVEVGTPLYSRSTRAVFGAPFMGPKTEMGPHHYAFYPTDWNAGGTTTLDFTSVELLNSLQGDANTLYPSVQLFGSSTTTATQVYAGIRFNAFAENYLSGVKTPTTTYPGFELSGWGAYFYIDILEPNPVAGGVSNVYWDGATWSNSAFYFQRQVVIGEYANIEVYQLRNASLTLVPTDDGPSTLGEKRSKALASLHLIGGPSTGVHAISEAMVAIGPTDAFVGFGISSDMSCTGTQVFTTYSVGGASYMLRHKDGSIYLQTMNSSAVDGVCTEANHVVQFNELEAIFHTDEIAIAGLEANHQTFANHWGAQVREFQISTEGTGIFMGFNTYYKNGVYYAGHYDTNNLTAPQGHIFVKTAHTLDLMYTPNNSPGAVVTPVSIISFDAQYYDSTLDFTFSSQINFNQFAVAWTGMEVDVSFDAYGIIRLWGVTSVNSNFTVTGQTNLNNVQIGGPTVFINAPIQYGYGANDLTGSSWINGDIVKSGSSGILVTAETLNPSFSTVAYIPGFGGDHPIRINGQRTGNRVTLEFCSNLANNVWAYVASVTGPLKFYTDAALSSFYNLPVNFRPIEAQPSSVSYLKCQQSLVSYGVPGSFSGKAAYLCVETLVSTNLYNPQLFFDSTLSTTANSWTNTNALNLRCTTMTYLTDAGNSVNV